MKSPHDNAIDPLGTLGAPIRPEKPAQPDPVKAFEHINDQAKAVETIAEAINPAVEQHHEDAWQGCDFAGYADLAWLLGCI